MLTGVVHPCSAEALAGALEAAAAGLIVPVLFGPEAELRQVAAAAKLDLAGYRIVATDGTEDSALKAAAAAGAGEVQALMKGSLHTDVLLHAIMQKDAKLRTGRLLSHCAMISVPTYARRFVVSDVALNIAPDTDQKRDICQNAIGFARALGIDTPKVAVLAAVETVTTKCRRRSTARSWPRWPIAARLSAASSTARSTSTPRWMPRPHGSSISSSPVAGLADVLIVPNIEAGNMVYKNLAFMADAQTAAWWSARACR
jgi:phosphate acetyltransferase